MRRLLLGLALPFLMATGCELEPDDPVFLSGTVLEADGTPWRGGPLTLKRPRLIHPGNYDTGVPPQSEFEPWAEVVPGADGTFLHRLTARDTGADGMNRPHPWLDPGSFQLLLPGRGDGSRDLLAFYFSKDVDLPPLRRWESGLRTEPEGAGFRLFWEPMPVTADIPESRYFVRVRSDAGLAWSVIADSGGAWLGPETREDFDVTHAQVQARASGTRVWLQYTLSYTAVHESPLLPLPFEGRIPVSRGAECRADNRNLEPCPFTDGSLQSVRVSPGGNALPRELIVRLREPVRPTRVLVRGLVSTTSPGAVLHVEGAVDGGPWLPLGSSEPLPAEWTYQGPYDDASDYRTDSERFVDVPLAADAPAVTQVRVWEELGPPPPGAEPGDWVRGPTSFSYLREVSVFAAP